MHVDGLDKLPGRLAVLPVMRERKASADIEVARQVAPEIIERNDIAERMVDQRLRCLKFVYDTMNVPSSFRISAISANF